MIFVRFGDLFVCLVDRYGKQATANEEPNDHDRFENSYCLFTHDR